MDEVVSAMKSPGWWVLTVLVGLVLNVFAPFINRWIERTWEARSEKRRRVAIEDEEAVTREVISLAGKPTGLIEAKLDALYWTVRIVLALTIFLMLIQICFAIPSLPGQLAVAPLSLMAFFSITGFWRRWKRTARIHNELRLRLGKT